MFPDPDRLDRLRLSALSGHPRRSNRSHHGIAENHRSLKDRTQENEMREKTELTTQQLEKVGGGYCTPEQLLDLTKSLTDAYETLIDFTSYVMDRISK